MRDCKYTPQGWQRMLRLGFWPHTHTYTPTLKKSTGVQLSVAFASEVKANQKLTTVFATEGFSVF